jgi:uncharacterized protein (DUF305 family)
VSEDAEPARSAQFGAVRLRVAIVLGGILLLVIGLVVGRITTPSASIPGTLSAEAGFARDMQVHHAQAIDLALIVRDRTADPDVRQLAYDIARSQQQQAGQMYGWLDVWGLPQASPVPAMTWMTAPVLGQSGGHEMELPGAAATPAPSGTSTAVPGGRMPGMAEQSDIERLKTLSGVDAERLFLDLMISHHRGGVEMAQALVERSANPTVVAMARNIIAAQSSEIDYMTQLLAQRS